MALPNRNLLNKSNGQPEQPANPAVKPEWAGSPLAKYLTEQPAEKNKDQKDQSKIGEYGLQFANPMTEKPEPAKATEALHSEDNANLQKENASTLRTGDENVQDRYNTQNAFDKGWTEYGRNLAQDPVHGTLTGKNFASTLASSRLADMLNNRVHLRVDDIGARTNSSFGSTGIQGPQLYRMPAVETEEIRSMDRARAVQAQSEQAAQRRQDDLNNISVQMAQMMPKQEMDLLARQGYTNDALRSAAMRAVQQVEYDYPGAQHWQEKLQQFMQLLTHNIRSREIENVRRILDKDTAWGNYVGMAYFGNSNYSLDAGMYARLRRQVADAYKDNPAAQMEAMLALDAYIAQFQYGMAAMSFKAGAKNIAENTLETATPNNPMGGKK